MKIWAARLGTAVVALAITAVSAGAQGRGQGAPMVPVDPHDLTGYWELSFDSRNVPPADLAPGLTKAMLDEAQTKTAKAIRWCNLMGMPFLMGTSRPLDIRIGMRETVIVPESSVAAARHIYTDRATHVDPNIWDPTTNGDSIGHWEGDTFVVDTVGFHPDRGNLMIPGGGFRTADSHLVERFRLMKNSQVLSVVSTWTDPKIYKTPHTYEFRYYRQPKNYEARSPIACNAFDQDRIAFLTGPPQMGATTAAIQ